jgi:2'-5' RNA ligase
LRTFLAFELEESVRQQISALTARLRQMDQKVRWVKPENMHVTVYFFGEIQENALPALEVVCADAVDGTAPFEIGVRGISAFPSLERARVIWYGIHDNGQLKSVYQKVCKGLEGAGIVERIETRPYTAHLTAGRVKGAVHRKLVEGVQELKDTDLGSSLISEFILFKSTLTRSGPIYERVRHFPL